jgi:peroxiredoxin
LQTKTKILARTLAICLTACLSTAALAKESKFNEKLSVGEPAPDFSDLPGIDGKQHALSDYQQAKAVVVVFTSNKCPVALAYDDRLIALQEEFGERGVQLIAICANFEAGHELDALQEHAASQHINFPYVRDDSQAIAQAYGATHTPQVFLLGGDRHIAYMGAIDDSEDPKQVTQRYLQDAIDAVLAGNAPTTTETQPVGCRIRFKRQRASRT